MAQKTILDELEDYRMHRIQKERLLENIAQNRSAIERCTSMISPSGGFAKGYNRDKMLNFMTKQEEYEIALMELIEKEVSHMLLCEKMIEHLNEIEKMLFRYYYFDGNTWDEVAPLIGYSREHCIRLANKAKKKLLTAYHLISC